MVVTSCQNPRWSTVRHRSREVVVTVHLGLSVRAPGPMADGHFTDGHLAERIFGQQTFGQTDIWPKGLDIMAEELKRNKKEAKEIFIVRDKSLKVVNCKKFILKYFKLFRNNLELKIKS